ncbi:helix-turn-helix transcriptional regulator [Parahaliea maris]|uniref:Helix-turn-helix transcriptional regulator n=1 Tax=Parahaliea maris TaxID=2716870 RepID=A0A5C9A790_9GAMM|nr:helix-turn-helix domain-containing protein [Parahaliea maris]TXS95969.1 helix-turn-helix transcriptional regulator [Parahaliea maris]
MPESGYGQFCPISKALEILGEKWTLLIIRELLMGGTRFNELQRGLASISPSLLTRRLASLEQDGLLAKRKIAGQKGYEYFPTESCKELLPVLEQVGSWGMRWARNNLVENDFDIELLMLYMERSIDPEKLPGRQAVICFNFTDVTEFQRWWVVVEEEDVDVCVHDPGKEVDVYINVELRAMCELWMGDVSYRRAQADKRLQLLGDPALTRSIGSWITPSIFAGIEPATAIVAAQ